MSTKGLSVTQQKAVLAEAELLGVTGKLTTAELNAILVNKKRNKDQAEALLIKTGLITAETSEATATNVVTASKLKELVQTKALTQAEANLIATKAGVTLANQKESVSFLTGVGSKIKGLGNGLKSVGTGILTLAKAHPVVAGITTALTVGTVAVGIYKKKQEEAAQAIKEAYENAKTAIDDINNTFNENSSKTKEIAKEYAELAQGVDLLTNKNEKLSIEKYERFLDLSNQLSSLYPPLTKSYDENGNAILNLSGDVDTIVGSLDDLIERQRELANQEIVEQMPDLFKGYSNNVTDYEEQVDNAKKTRDNIQKAYDEISKYGIYTAFDLVGNAKDANGDPVALKFGDYIELLKTLGITAKAVDLKDSMGQLIGHKIVLEDGGDIPNISGIYDSYISAFNKAEDDVKYAQQQLDTERSSINQYLNTWLQGEFSYLQIEDSGLQTAIQDMLFNFDFSNIPEDKRGDWNYVSEYLRRNILFEINNVQDDPVISKALSEVFTNTELTPSEKSNYLQQIQDYFGEGSSIVISLKPQIDETEILQKQYDKAIEDTKAKFDDYDPTAFFKENSINTQEEIDKWLKIAQAANSAAEAEERYLAIDAPLFSAFDNTDFGDRLQHITDLFDEGSITVKQYFDALQTEIDNFDASNFTESIEDMNKASEQFFIDSVQQTASGLSDLINSFDSEEMNISEYLEDYLAIGNTLNTLTDSLQENSALWNENGEAISSAENAALDETQTKLANAMATIQSYQDSIYSLEQIMTNSVEAGSKEFSAHAQVIAQDLYNIVQSGGLMADEIKNRLGSTTSEIAQSLTESVANQELACQAITNNTNNEITDMATAIGELFDTLGNAISNFKVDLSFGVKSIDWEKVNVLGIDLSLPKIKFELGASGESLQAIGDAVASFGKAISSNYGKQTINLEDYHFGDTDGAGKGKYTPSPGIVGNYKNALDNIKDSDSTESTSQTAEKLNWIECLINKISTAYNKLKNVVSNTADTWLNRNNALSDSMQVLLSEIDAQSKAYDYYMNLFNSYGLDEYYKNQIANGSINIEVIYDDNLKEAISECQDLYDKAQDAKDEVQNLNIELSTLSKQKFDDVASQFDDVINKISAFSNQLSKELDIIEEKGWFASKVLNNKLIEQEQKNLNKLESERMALINALNEAVNSGRIEEESEDWYDMQSQIDDVTSAILDSKKALIEYQNAIRQINWDAFDRTRDDVTDLIEETEFLVDLFKDIGTTDDKGNFNDYGKAAQALLAQNYQLYLSQADEYSKEILKINEELANNPFDQNLLDRRQELLEAQQDAIQAAQDEKDAIKDLVSDAYSKYMDSLNELIDKYKELLQTQKDAYNYEKTIREKTEALNALEKQYSAYQGDNSEEGKKNIQELKEQINEAKDDLQETEYDKLISDTEKLLDELSEETQTWLDSRLDDIDALINDIIEQSNKNSSDISQTIISTADNFGYKLSDSMSSIWKDNTNNITDVLSEYGNKFNEGQTTLNNTVNAIKEFTQKMLANSDAEAARAAEELAKQQAEQSANTDGGYSNNGNNSNSGDSYWNSGGDNGNSSSSDGDIQWIYEKNYYPTDQLNIDTSIVDRLKWNDFASSFEARSQYYSQMGGEGNYYATYDQNVWMLEWMKRNGYANGTKNATKGLHLFDEDGIGSEVILTKHGTLKQFEGGEHVFDSQSVQNLWELAQFDPSRLAPDLNFNYELPKLNNKGTNNDVKIEFGDVSMNFPNVQNYEDFMRKAQKDTRFEKMIQEMTLGQTLGNNSLNKLQF